MYNLVSKYTLKHIHKGDGKVNRDDVDNIVNRKFAGRRPLEVVVSDLTYVKCAGKWHYICILLDLNGKKIIGSAVGRQKDAKLVRTAFYGVQDDLRRIEIFHTDRGSEFKNKIIDEIIEAFGIKRSLSRAGTPKGDGKVNRDDVDNIVDRKFAGRRPLEVVVSDLTYVKCAGKWHYICILLDLNGKKIIGSAVGRQKDAKLVRTAFYGVQDDLRRIEIFHTDRGSEFKNKIIDEIIEAFGIKRSLSRAGTPIDNSCAESIYNIIKTEFVYGEEFSDFDELQLKWFDYVNRYNNVRIHGSLGYMTPNEYKEQALSPPEFIAR
ncbi:MAG: IS3 family transposase [Clostridia bacterium]